MLSQAPRPQEVSESVEKEFNYAELSKERMEQVVTYVSKLASFLMEKDSALLELSEGEVYEQLLIKMDLQAEDMTLPELGKIEVACRKIAHKIQIIRKYRAEAQTDPVSFLQENCQMDLGQHGPVQLEINALGFLVTTPFEDEKSFHASYMHQARNEELNHLCIVVNRDNYEPDTIKHEQNHALNSNFFVRPERFTPVDEWEANRMDSETAFKTYEGWIENELQKAYHRMHGEFSAYVSQNRPDLFHFINAYGAKNYANLLDILKSAVGRSKLPTKNKKKLYQKITDSFQQYKQTFQRYQSAVVDLFKYSSLDPAQLAALVFITPPPQLEAVAKKFIEGKSEETEFYGSILQNMAEDAEKWAKEGFFSASTPEERHDLDTEAWQKLEQQVVEVLDEMKPFHAIRLRISSLLDEFKNSFFDKIY